MRNKLLVAPLAGAWIEMRCNIARFCACIVAPLAGAWIEIPSIKEGEQMAKRRSPRGSVD